MAEQKKNEYEKPNTLYLSREEFNHLIVTLDLMAKIGEQNSVTDIAENLKKTILRYASKPKRNKDDRAAVILYEREACPLIKLLLFYIAAFRIGEPHDFFSEIRKNKKESETT